MKTLHQTLQETDDEVIVTIAEAWQVKTSTNPGDLRQQLGEIMLQPEQAEQMWESLTDNQRQALQTLLGSNGKMYQSMFKRLFGEIRRMGRAGIEREQPHKNPATAAEALFYRGLITEAFFLGDAGSQAMVFVPEDLMLVLPTHKTAYDDLEAPEHDAITAMDASELSETRPADTSIVDDMTTLLAFLQLHGSPVDGDSLAPNSIKALLPYLLTKNEARVTFLLTVGIHAELINIQDGRAYPQRAEARRWLSATRSEQIQMLVNAWLDCLLYRELWHVPGLTPEQTDNYNPTLARKATLSAMRGFVPESEWWDVDEFIYSIKTENPDFQRPGGDYDSWYILDMTDEYVHGFESWDTVEASLLEFIINGPMHWLGLLDVAPEAARLTAYGRGVLELTPFPNPPEPAENITVQADGSLLVSRKVSRLDRFQAARFTSWQPAPSLASGEPYTYVLDGRGITQANTQGITTEHISAFLKRMLDNNPFPERIERMLTNWRQGDTAAITLTQMIVLRTTSEDTLNAIIETPETRRFLGARLGPLAVAVRAEQWESLQNTLIELGMDVQVLET